MRKRPSRSITALAFALAACETASPPDPAPVIWTGRRVELASNGGLTMCGGTAEYLDAFAVALIDDLDLDVGPDERARVYLLSEEELEALEFCPPGARCVYEDFVYTDVVVENHELVHAVRGIQYGENLPGPTFFEEGLATMYMHDGFELPSERDLSEGLTSASNGLRGRLSAWWYGLGGDFVLFLARGWGMSSIADTINGLSHANTVEDVDRAFLESLGTSFGEAALQYESEVPRCSKFARTRHLVECAQDPLQLPASVDFELECGSPSVIGPLDGVMWQTFTFEVEEEELLLLRPPETGEPPFQQPGCDGFTLQVTDCERGCLDDIDIQRPRDGDDAIEDAAVFKPGRYVVRLGRPVDHPGRACLEVRPFPE